MLNVALTGNVASGKSSVADRWSTLGVPVVSADELAREAVQPGSEGLARVVDAFGDEVLAPDGRLDRDRLRGIVFDDAEARRRLEEILHPIIWRLRESWLNQRRAEGAALAVSEIPLLFETGREGDFDAVVFVDAPEDVRLARMVESRGMDPAEARRVIASQMGAEEKRARADWVMANVGTLSDLELLSDRVLAELRSRAGQASLRMDLHLHTNGSWDCLSDPEAVLARAVELGYGRIAITDHNRIGVARDMADRHPERVIVGEEVETGEGFDLIGLYLTEEIAKGTPARETIERIREQGGLVYLPHPFAWGKGGGGVHVERLAPLCDVVEVFNARLHAQKLNARARDLAIRHGTLRGAGSDAHTVGEIGSAHVDLPVHPNRADALRAALGQGRVEGRESPLWVHLASTWAKVRKKLP